MFEQYEKFLAGRRGERSSEEYRQPTADELTEFGEHFGRRRIELGDCVRPYGTGCIHKHACFRCDFLTVQPDAADRMQTIETDLQRRIDTAEQNRWLGDVKQLRINNDPLSEQEKLTRDKDRNAPQPDANPGSRTSERQSRCWR